MLLCFPGIDSFKVSNSIFYFVVERFNLRVTTALYVECDNEREIRTTVRRQLFCINTNFSKATFNL